ncbi:MAG: hypothetical protein E7341_01790 [Clostridiales bacterium]|nr:hypothetical protein [Clostridiales bacterium]
MIKFLKAIKRMVGKPYRKMQGAYIKNKQARDYYHMSREKLVSKVFKEGMGYYPNLDNPQTFNEKVCWMKVNYYNPLAKVCADKYGVREYLKALGHEDLLIKQYGVYGSAKQIKIEDLPETPFILKTNHGCGGHLICKDKSKLEQKHLLKVLGANEKKNINYATHAQEWVYEHITPMILCEEFLDEDGHSPMDYKIICNNGKVKFLYVCKRFDCAEGVDHELTIFDRDFNKLPCTWSRPNLSIELKKPKNYDKMIALAEELSKPFPFVRVDFYNINGKLYFGEFTFFPWSGRHPFQPAEYDKILGDMIELPEKQETPFNYEK